MTAFQATYADFRIVKGRKVAQIVIEVPLEQADAALDVLGGVPRPDQERWVGVARIDPNAKPEPEAPTPPKGGKYAQRAGIVCNEPRFWKFASKSYRPVRTSDEAADFVRSHCGIVSRAELDANQVAEWKFRNLMAEYDEWCRT